MKLKNTFKSIRAAHGKMTKLAEEVAKAESDVVLAQNELEKAKCDDGTLSAGEIYDRTEAARKEHGIRTIEANRAAAKITECEDDFRETVKQAFTEIDNWLSTKAAEARKTTAQKLKDIVGDFASSSSEFHIIVAMAEPVALILALQKNLNRAAYNPGGEPNYLNPSFISGLFEAEALL